MAKILIIEDQEALIKNLQLALQEDFEVIVSTLGKEGLKQASSQQPDLILLDIMLPDMDGIEILKHLQKDEKTEDIPVIVFTNLGDKETVSRILDAGGTDYLIKSDWKISEVVDKIKSTIK